MSTIQDNQKLAESIAKALGGDFCYNDENRQRTTDWCFSIQYGHGRILFQQRKDKLEISGLPISDDVGSAVPTKSEESMNMSMNVSASKAIDKIAVDIKRRLIPSYNSYIKRALEIVAARRQYKETMDSIKSRVLKHVPGTFYGDHVSNDGIDVHVYHDRIEITTKINVDQFEEFMELTKKFQTPA